MQIGTDLAANSIGDALVKSAATFGVTCLLNTAVIANPPLLPNYSNFPEEKKKVLGQFFTQENFWLCPQVRDFILKSGARVAYDPFAGDGNMLEDAQKAVPSLTEIKGLDIDASLGWEQNDSLIKIPHVEGGIILTNPPYISNYSARRKKINEHLEKYFKLTDYDDLYLLALDRMLEAQEYVVAIVPETFINSSYRQKGRLSSITILESNPFSDTETPVVVLCFDGVNKHLEEVKVYKDADYVCTLKDVEDSRIKPSGGLKIKFNDRTGWLAVRCVDTTNPSDMIRFSYKEEIDYDWENSIKHSSRLLTLVDVDIPEERRTEFINKCNEILESLRKHSHDIILSPFKGNMKNGIRRRRLDFLTCRAIIECAHNEVFSNDDEELKELNLLYTD